jgi:hypothetical protein
MTNTETTAALRQSIAQALSRAGSCCGQCGFQPGETGCPDCRRHWEMCADELLPVLAEAPLALSDPERAMLQFALELGQDQVFSRSSEFTDEDTAALESLHTRAAAEGVR